MKTWQDLINAWGGPSQFADSIGVSVDAAYKMRQRGFVNHVHWTRIVARAPHAGLQGITLEFLLTLESGRQSPDDAPRFPGQEVIA
jgi:hypothetical protein